MDRLELHKRVTEHMHTVYAEKNSDYGNSFAKVREKYKDNFPVIMVRLEDKMNRLETLLVKGTGQRVMNESITDTLMDLACYCVMEIVERELEQQNVPSSTV